MRLAPALLAGQKRSRAGNGLFRFHLGPGPQDGVDQLVEQLIRFLAAIFLYRLSFSGVTVDKSTATICLLPFHNVRYFPSAVV